MPSLLRPALFAAAALGVAGTEAVPSFEEYLAAHGLSYPPEELEQRRALYDGAAAKVREQNANPSKLWEAEVNEFAVKTEAETQAMYGLMKQTGVERTATFRRSRNAIPVDSFDWRDVTQYKGRPSVVTPVKNQGGCGSCWAFAASAAIESAVAISTGILFELSPQQLTSCTPNPEECGGSGGCFGATTQLAFNYTAKFGLTSLWTYPYTSGLDGKNGECYELAGRKKPNAGITGYVQLPQNDAQALLEAVLITPVTISVAASGWGAYRKGIFDGCNVNRPIINHAVVLNGFGKEDGMFGTTAYWTIRNSWGPTWGEQGYIRIIRYEDGEPCGVDDEPLDGYSCKSNPPKSITACGMCGLLADSAYPVGGFLGAPAPLLDPALKPKADPALAQVGAHAFAGLPDSADGAAFIQLPLSSEL